MSELLMSELLMSELIPVNSDNLIIPLSNIDLNTIYETELTMSELPFNSDNLIILLSNINLSILSNINLNTIYETVTTVYETDTAVLILLLKITILSLLNERRVDFRHHSEHRRGRRRLASKLRAQMYLNRDMLPGDGLDVYKHWYPNYLDEQDKQYFHRIMQYQPAYYLEPRPSLTLPGGKTIIKDRLRKVSDGSIVFATQELINDVLASGGVH